MKSIYTETNPEYHHENQFGYIYIMVHPGISKGRFNTKTELDTKRITNIAIYNLNQNQLRYLFPKNQEKEILVFLYESNYQRTGKTMHFNVYHSKVINNNEIPKREPSDNLFILKSSNTKDQLELWMAKKSGENLRLFKAFPKAVKWRIDVKNQKILFIQQLPNEVKIETLDW